MHKTIIAVIGILLIFFSENSAASTYKLVLLEQERGAACLDGSPAGIYLNEGTGTNSTKYLIYFNGGGFCGGKTLS
jgi:hypothetical protein